MLVRSILSSYSRLLAGVLLAAVAVALAGCNDSVAQRGEPNRPVLVGDDIVAAIDLKADRQNRKLLLQKWSWVGNGAKRDRRKELKQRIEEALDRFERFQLAE